MWLLINLSSVQLFLLKWTIQVYGTHTPYHQCVDSVMGKVTEDIVMGKNAENILDNLIMEVRWHIIDI